MRTQGARSNDKSLANEPADHALGRSRGGPSTKIHALTDTFCCPLTLLLSPGHRRQPLPGAPARRAPRPRHRSVPPAGRQGVLAPEHPSTRKNLRKSRILRTTPERRDQIRRRKAKGSGGGRPPTFDKDRYRERNAIERGFGRLKQWRGIATRYDQYATTFLGGVLLAALVIHHRVRK